MTTAPLAVAIDTGPLYGHRTGVGQAVDGMVAALARRSDVSLDRYLMSFRTTPRPGDRKLPVPGIVASHMWSRADRPRADRWLGAAAVVHGTNYVAPPSSLPTVVSVYDCWFLAHPELAGPVVSRAGRTLRRRVEAGAWVHATSEATASRVRELLGTDRVRTILLGGPEPAASGDGPAPPAIAPLAAELGGRPFVLSLATEERRKGIPLLVESFRHLRADHADVALVVAGAAGDDSTAIDRAIATAGDLRIHRLGAVDDGVKRWLLRHAAVLAYPSLDEGFGFPVLEAQAAGTPVVATSVGSLPEVAGDAAVLVEDRSAEAFAAAIGQVLGGGVGRLGLIEAGFRNVKRFDWDRTADELVDLYRTALDDS